MKFIKIYLFILFAGVITSCKDQLDVKNPNEPVAAFLKTETGIVKFAMGGIYINGFVDLKYQDGVVGQFWGNGFFDLMADNIGAEAANVFMNQIGCPETVTLKDINGNDSIVYNPNAPSHQPDMLRQNNLNSNTSQNPLYYEWAYMYALNRSCNLIISSVDEITFTGNADTKKNLLKAWAYWWKGFSYSRIGSIYYAGLIVEESDVVENPSVTSSDYKTNGEILAAAESNFAKAETILNTITENADYDATLGKIIPDFCLVGHGGIITPAMWIRNINTMRARNLLMNKTITDMVPTDWDQVITLTNAGITETDFVFTLRSNTNGDVISSQNGALSAKSTGDPASAATYKISERLIQAFQDGDSRMTNNFDLVKDDKGNPSAWIGNSDRGNSFNTRWELLDGGNGMDGVIVYSDKSVGAYELFMAGSYEENELMKAEAQIYKNNVETGVGIIDDIRDYQGAGLDALVGTGLSQVDAITQLRSERRVALLFRSVAFYDARRYGVIKPLIDGGGLTGAVVVDGKGNIDTNATIDYQFLDYWDVPDNELAYNPPASGSAAVVNPNE